MFEGAVNAWRNASLDAAKCQIEAKIGDRTNWILPAIWPRAKMVGNYLVGFCHSLTSLVTGCDAKEPPPMPALPEVFTKSALGDGLTTAYKQKCDAVIASAESTKCLVNLDFTGYRSNQAIQKHDVALNGIALPEDKPSFASGASSLGLGAMGGVLAKIAAEKMGVNLGKGGALLTDPMGAAKDMIGQLVASNAGAVQPAAKQAAKPVVQA